MLRPAAAVALLLLAESCRAWGPPNDYGGKYKPGWNGLASKPPMGWRSWNAFGNRITQEMMLDAAEAIVSKNRTVAGHAKPVSLCDIGYCSVGVDEGWEGCGQGVDKTQHDASGIPTIDAAFPDTATMVKQIHAKGLAAGWYLNGCKCGEHVEKTINYEGDIKSLRAFDFDGVKIDGCGHQRNQTLYAELMAASGKNYTIENCHWGDCTDSDDSSCPTETWCPFNWYRSSGDINAGSESWMRNLQSTIKFQDWAKPLSQPGCWAYPDMLEVGRVAAPTPESFLSWNRAHFGAWCVTSSPLILGLDITDDAKLAPILDIIGNPDAIAVNQQWAGHPGMMVENVVAPPQAYAAGGVTVPSSSAGDFDMTGGAAASGGRPDKETSGANIRTGGPGGTGLIRIGTGLLAKGHSISTLSMSFRYVAGYTPAPGQTKKAPVVKVVLLDMASSAVLKTVFTSEPLGNYSYDHFTQYSPPIEVKATAIDVPNDKAVIVALQVNNEDRNLQIPIDNLADGFDLKIGWSAGSSVGFQAEAPYVPGFGVTPPAPFGSGQLWAKKQPGGAAAVLFINHSPKPQSYNVSMAKLNLTASSYTVHDIWTRKSAGEASKELKLPPVPAYDSAFLLLTPA
jgi:alpha-galactosidase